MAAQSQNQFAGFSPEGSSRAECDVLVVGSGAGGLSAAVTAAFHGLKVIVAEKEPVFGGTTAWSGGWMWTPRNELARRAGIVEDAEAPRSYLRNVLGNNFNQAKVDAFLEAAPRMVTFFAQNTALQFEDGNRICDTYGDVPGAGTGGRSVIAAPFDARRLGDLVRQLRHPLRETTFMGMTIQAGPDLAAFMNIMRSPRAFAHVAHRFGRHLEHGPFFAVKVVPGSFGTFAGLKTDGTARVLGLYAAGTDMASVMGGHYPAGGINLGPAMTFGYIAGRHLAGEPDFDAGSQGF
jgi:succinate dehydrogenase/fumarate reductase flavoprotein subunit